MDERKINEEIALIVAEPRSPISQCNEFSSNSFEEELKCLDYSEIISDELPIFQIASISPSGRSISPIDDQGLSPRRPNDPEINEDIEIESLVDIVTLEEINSQIGLTPLGNSNSRNISLETIFEGVFFETPPSKPELRRYSRKLTGQSAAAKKNNSSDLGKENIGKKPKISSQEKTTDISKKLF